MMSFENQLIIEKIQQALKEEELIFDPFLNLYEFAKAIDEPARKVSSLINSYFKISFRGLINPYRVNKAKDLIESTRGEVKLADIGQQCGFKSRTTFYLAFKQAFGVSPMAYLGDVLGKSE